VPGSDVQPSRQHKFAARGYDPQLRPKTVILPYWKRGNPDHHHASTLGYEACFLAGLKQLPIQASRTAPQILYSSSYADVRRRSSWTSPRNTRRAARPSSLRVAIRPSKSEKKNNVHLAIDRLETEMNQLARHYGQMIGVEFGEPFCKRNHEGR